jgi:hypothetical protein
VILPILETVRGYTQDFILMTKLRVEVEVNQMINQMIKLVNKTLIFMALLLFFNLPDLYAGEADVLKVDVKKHKKNTYRFSVTVLHKDTGWKHYADKWDISGEDGTIFGTRILHHPHEDEQPFTRSLSNVVIPESVKTVIVRAHDSVHKYGGKVMKVELP